MLRIWHIHRDKNGPTPAEKRRQQCGCATIDFLIPNLEPPLQFNRPDNSSIASHSDHTLPGEVVSLPRIQSALNLVRPWKQSMFAHFVRGDVSSRCVARQMAGAAATGSHFACSTGTKRATKFTLFIDEHRRRARVA